VSHDTESLEALAVDSPQRRAALARARQARLVVALPYEEPPLTIALDGEPLELGRERLGDASVSRRHLTARGSTASRSRARGP
jgi:hypothetical protein